MYQQWRSPTSSADRRRASVIKRSDPDRGWERIGRYHNTLPDTPTQGWYDTLTDTPTQGWYDTLTDTPTQGWYDTLTVTPTLPLISVAMLLVPAWTALIFSLILWKCNSTNLVYNNNLGAAGYANRKYKSDAA